MTLQQSNYIKTVAAAAMLIDHIGAVLFPDILALRAVGRLAFPLFAYQIGTGYANTKSFKRYLSRVLIFALSMQAVLIFAAGRFDVPWQHFNTFFTLAAGLCAIHFFDKGKHIYLIPMFMMPAFARHFGFSLDYGEYGIALILLLFYFRERHFQIFIAMLALNTGYCLISGNPLQMLSIFSFIFIIRPHSIKIHIPAAAFYLFYPLHLALLYLINNTI